MWDVVALAETPRDAWEDLGHEVRLRRYCSRRWGVRVWGTGGLTLFARPRAVWGTRVLTWMFAAALAGLMVRMYVRTRADYTATAGELDLMRFALGVFWLGFVAAIWMWEKPLLLAVRRGRTRRVERLRRRIAAGLAGAGEMAALGENVRRRWGAWESGRSRVSWFTSRFGIALTDRWSATLFYGVQALNAGVLTVTPREPWAMAAMQLAMMGMFGMIIASLVRASWLRRRVAKLAKSRLCPDCGHDLNGTPAGIRAELLGGVDVGPRRCVECGVAWPLVPPEVW